MSLSKTVIWVEKHVITKTHSCYSLLQSFCHKAKNLYNHANYIVRNTFVTSNKWIRYAELDKLLRADEDYPDYKEMPTAQTAQQLLRLLDSNWKAFFSSIKDWKAHKDKYNGRPRLPKYLKKDRYQVLTLTNQNCKLKDGVLHFPRVFEGFTIKPQFVNKANFVSFQQVRLIPHKDRIVVELIYNISVDESKGNNNRFIGIDIGVNNLATICNNVGLPAFAINGRPLKSINQHYNKLISRYQEICKRMNARDYSNRMNKLTEKRNARIDSYLHKASRMIVNYCEQNQINTIVIGKNPEWKQNSKLSKRINQSFVQIPFTRFINMIQYKAEELGIAVILTEESYTSGTSFIDNEDPIKENYNKARRIKRGLFISNEDIAINADLNGAYQILKKVIPIKWDSGCALHPVVVSIS